MGDASLRSSDGRSYVCHQVKAVEPVVTEEEVSAPAYLPGVDRRSWLLVEEIKSSHVSLHPAAWCPQVLQNRPYNQRIELPSTFDEDGASAAPHWRIPATGFPPLVTYSIS